MKIYFAKFDKELEYITPQYQSDDSAGMDLCSASRQKIIIPTGETRLIPTNIVLEIPKGYEGQIRPRSGLALKHNITVLNSPGTIDSDYRGEIKILLINHGKDDFEVKFGDRIAQLIITKYERVNLVPAQRLTETSRGQGGYGSTGI
ncbi:MAG: dUTP diphosphatase [Ignavibacteria bacterium]|nr:dUTP diphosphatase [Ignavibacteria bacterium]